MATEREEFDVTRSSAVEFHDLETGDDAVVIVRHDATSVALCVSLKSGGDVEVRMKKEEAKRVIEALSKAT